MTDHIEVICNDPGHADGGKVAKIATFTRPLPGAGWIGERRHGYRAFPDTRRGGSRHLYECKLCGLSLDCSTKTLDWLLDGIAAHGVSETTLKALILVASTRRS
jgi:hypothetical protein